MPAFSQLAKRIYRTLGLDGYARIDFRLAADGTPYFIEANPDPEIAKSEEFATAARHDELDYPDLLASHSGARNEPCKGGRIRRLRRVCGREISHARFIYVQLFWSARRLAVRRVGKANGSRECAPDDRLRVPTMHGRYCR